MHAKDNTLGIIKGYKVRLAAQEVRTDKAESLVAAVPQLASVRTVEHFTINQLRSAGQAGRIFEGFM